MSGLNDNPSRSARIMAFGLALMALCAVGVPLRAQTVADASRGNDTALRSPRAEVPQGPQGRRYTQTFPVTGGVRPYSFALAGDLPAGMHWTTTDTGILLDGVPQAAGNFPIEITVTDAAGQRCVQPYVLDITPNDTGSSVNVPVSEPISVTDTPSVGTTIKVNVAETVSVADAPAVLLPVVVTISELVTVTDTITLTPSVWLAVSEPVSVTDTPAVFFPIEVSVAEAVSVTDSVAMAPSVWVSVSEPISVTDTPSIFFPVQVNVSESVSVTDLIGTATSVFISVSEPVTVVDTPSITFQPLTITSANNLPGGTLNSAYSFTFAAQGGSASGYTWQLQSGSLLPRGMQLSSAGLLDGTPTIYGTFSFGVVVRDSLGATAAQTETLVIASTATGTSTQSLSPGAIPTVSYSNSSFTLNATASSGLAPVYVVLSGPANGTNPFTVTGAGAVSIYVEQPGNSQYKAATPLTLAVTINPSVLTVTPANLSRVFDGMNPVADTYMLTGFQHNDTSSVVSGSPAEYLTPAVGTSPPGSYALTADVTGLSAANYTFSSGSGTLTVTGGAGQSLLFPQPPDIPVTSTLRLAAEATSGLAVTYSVTGPATVAGNVVTPTGTGTITITAAQAGNTNYAAAPNVSRSVQVQ